MHRVTELAAGVRGAENGHAYVYRRGTFTPVQWWSDFEGLVAQAVGTEIDLDANGAASVYVNEFVDVVVKDSTDVQIKDSVPGAASGAVEVRSTAFTGADYDTAVAAANKPMTLTDVLNLWKTKTGGTDWDLVVGGVSYTIIAALGQVLGLVFNVKSPEYGAVGDGSTDDSAAIQAANDAANATNGIVMFPPGEYRCNAQLTRSSGVWWIGCGSTATIITSHYVASTAVTGGSLRGDVVSGMLIRRGAYSTQTLFSIQAGTLYDVDFTDTYTDGVLCAATDTALRKCYFSGAYAKTSLTTANGATVEDCYFLAPATAFAATLAAGGGRFLGCTFNLGSVTSGAASGLTMSAGTRLAVHGCTFAGAAAASCTAMNFGSITADGAIAISEGDNTFTGTFAAIYGYTVTDATPTTSVSLQSRLGRGTYVAHTSGATVTLGNDDMRDASMVNISVQVAGVTQIDLANEGVPGDECSLDIRNDSGGSLTFDVGIAARTGGAITLAAGEHAILKLKSMYDDYSNSWYWSAVGKTQS